ncbi:MAG TPA: nitroreductase family protein [Candidatus Paceibacterota bacterium]|nr:nitroreductase family protein [Candidatus Paceibacterota bacterium]
MIRREDIQKVLEAGVQAPSGSNSQPWRFVVRDGKTVEIIALPEKDHPILNYRYRGTWIAHGALIENITVAARSLGFEPTIELFPEGKRPNLTARLTFSARPIADVSLAEAVFARATNRKNYGPEPLPAALLEELKREAASVGHAELKIMNDPRAVQALAPAVAVNEILMLEDKAVHKLFFEEIVWNKEELEKRHEGLYLPTMELPLPSRLGLRLCRSWGFMNILNHLGFARIIAKQNAAVYGAGGAVGVIVVPDDDKAFLWAGRVMERVWLTLTAHGYQMHLITGIFFFHQKMLSGDPGSFSAEHQRLVKEAYRKVAERFKIEKGELIALYFRLGRAAPPSATSPKQPPVVEWEP